MGGPADEGGVGGSEESLEFVLGSQGQSRACREGCLDGLKTPDIVGKMCNVVCVF